MTDAGDGGNAEQRLLELLRRFCWIGDAAFGVGVGLVLYALAGAALTLHSGAEDISYSGAIGGAIILLAAVTAVPALVAMCGFRAGSDWTRSFAVVAAGASILVLYVVGRSLQLFGPPEYLREGVVEYGRAQLGSAYHVLVYGLVLTAVGLLVAQFGRPLRGVSAGVMVLTLVAMVVVGPSWAKPDGPQSVGASAGECLCGSNTLTAGDVQ